MYHVDEYMFDEFIESRELSVRRMFLRRFVELKKLHFSNIKSTPKKLKKFRKI